MVNKVEQGWMMVTEAEQSWSMVNKAEQGWTIVKKAEQTWTIYYTGLVIFKELYLYIFLSLFSYSVPN